MILDDDTLEALGFGSLQDVYDRVFYERREAHRRAAREHARRLRADPVKREERNAYKRQQYRANPEPQKARARAWQREHPRIEKRPTVRGMYFPAGVLEEARAEAKRLGVSLSKVFQLAWKLSRG